jgi:exopolyphosphatase/guanosine-5'-triphosphate,3'-diphosphate pyrophosphatase
MNVAAVDIGTNSVRLLITDAAGAELERHMHITRLGQGVDASGSLHPDAIARTTAVLRDYAALLQRHGVQRVRATATSAARDADNSREFFDAAERALGTRPELLAGAEEARLSFRGATAGLDPAQGPFLVVDIGGGSTEFVVGTTGPEQLISIDMGCVRMTERHLRSDPPTQQQLQACFADVSQGLRVVREAVDVLQARLMIGLAGTVTALAAMQRGLRRYDPKLTHRSLLRRAEIETLFARLCAADLAGRRALLLEPERAGVIVGGAIVLLGILRDFDIEQLMVSEADILDGLAASLRDSAQAR